MDLGLQGCCNHRIQLRNALVLLIVNIALERPKPGTCEKPLGDSRNAKARSPAMQTGCAWEHMVRLGVERKFRVMPAQCPMQYE